MCLNGEGGLDVDGSVWVFLKVEEGGGSYLLW
jgi:hypothetical protein